MDHDIYKPPQSPLMHDQPTPAYYVVAKNKFLLLSISTLGIYFLYWMYKHWANQNAANNEDLWPIPRAIFYIFFTHSLFKRIHTTLEEKGRSFAWSHFSMATVFVVFALLGNVLDRIQWNEAMVENIMLSFLSLLTLAPMIWSGLQAQMAANLACDDPHGDQNADITPANTFWIIFGLLLWGLVLIGLFTLSGEPMTGIETTPAPAGIPPDL